MSIQRFKIEPPAPFSEKTRLFTDVAARFGAENIDKIWVAVDPRLFLIEALMLEVKDGRTDEGEAPTDVGP